MDILLLTYYLILHNFNFKVFVVFCTEKVWLENSTAPTTKLVTNKRFVTFNSKTRSSQIDLFSNCIEFIINFINSI